MLTDKEIEQKMNEIDMTICIPEKWMWGNSVSIIWSIAVAIMAKPPKVQIRADAQAPLSACRNRLVRSFLDSKSDWLLFLDDDTVPPQFAIPEMLKYTDEYDIVSGLYFRKSSNKGHKPVCFVNMHKEADGNYWWNTLTKWPPNHCEVDGFGMGCCLIPRYAFERILEKCGHPFFKYEFDDTVGFIREGEQGFMNMGEDLYFSKKAKDAGLKLGLATNVICQHTGPHMAISQKDYERAIRSGSMLGESRDLPITTPEQKLVIDDLAEYYNTDLKKIMEQVSLSRPTHVATYRSKYPKGLNTQLERNKFYASDDNYVRCLVGDNYFVEEHRLIRDRIALLSKGSFLDYGGGIGDVSIKVRQLTDKPITFAERPNAFSDFAKWRFDKHKLNIDTADINDKEHLDLGTFDTIACFDFLEYTIDPVFHLKNIKKCMHEKTNLLVGVDYTKSSGRYPLFLKHQTLDKLFAEAGLEATLIMHSAPVDKSIEVRDEKQQLIDMP